MATKPKRKKTTTVVEEIPEGTSLPGEEEAEPAEVDFSLEEVRTAEQLQSIMEQFPEAGITAKLYDDKGAFCYRLPDPASIDEEVIRKRCGSGDFTIRIYAAGKYRQSIPLPIRQLNPETPTVGNGNPDHHSAFIEKALLLLLEKQSTAAPPISTGPSLTDLTSALASLDQLRGKQESTMDIFQKGLDFAERISGNSDWKTDLIRGAKESLPIITQAITGARGGAAQPAGQPGQPGQVEENPVQQLPPENVIKSALVYLKKKCINGTDPELIIDWIVDNAEDYQPIIHSFFTMEFADIAKYDPEIGTGPFLPWFKQLYDGLRSAFSSPDTVVNDTGGTVGNGDNAGNDGKPSTSGVKK